MSATIINPATGQPVGEFEPLSTGEARAAVTDLGAAFREWSRSTIEDRHLVLIRLAQSLEDEGETLARDMARHLGKPIALGRREARQAEAVCRWHAEHAEELLADRPIGENPRRYTTPRPLGLSMGLAPGHSPVLETTVFVAANLLAGNGVVLGASGASVPVVRRLAEFVAHCGVPSDQSAMLPLEPKTIGELAELREVQLIWFSGDQSVGGEIARQAAAHLKRSVLQLDSNDAAIIAADADLERAARLCAQSCLENAGQHPWSLQRLIVDQAVLPVFQELLANEFSRWEPGDPLREDTLLGPLLDRTQRDGIHQQIQACAAQGADSILGGRVPDEFPEGSAFYPPTIVTNVAHGLALYDLPVRGPVAALIPVVDLGGAINIANDSAFGMGVSLFTNDVERAESLAREQLDSATVAINSLPGPRIDLPIGGLRRGGLGRLHGTAGFEHFINLKSVVVEDPTQAAGEGALPDSSGMRHEADPPRQPFDTDLRSENAATDLGDGVPV